MASEAKIEAIVYCDGAPGPWGVGWQHCVICTHRWIAVFPILLEELFCPSCGSIDTDYVEP